jgi:hypothetical protein
MSWRLVEVRDQPMKFVVRLSQGECMEQLVPGVRDHAADRISLAGAIWRAGYGRDGGIEPPPARQSPVYGLCDRGADRRLAPPAAGLGSAQSWRYCWSAKAYDCR